MTRSRILNFIAEDVTALMPGLEAISQNMIEDLCSICMPHGQRFYHFYPPTFSKMSDDMVTLAQDTKKPDSSWLRTYRAA